MREVGTFEAKTHLSALLDEVARGETIIRKRPTVKLLLPQPQPSATCASALGGRQPRTFLRCATKAGIEGSRPG